MICSECARSMSYFYMEDGTSGYDYEFTDTPKEPVFCHKCYIAMKTKEAPLRDTVHVPDTSLNLFGKLNIGRKDDKGKLRWDLLNLADVEEIVKVFTWAITEKDPPYEPNSWQLVDDPENRYFAALMRHIAAHQKGTIYDDESKLLTLSHIATDALILLHFVKERLKKGQLAKPMAGCARDNSKVYDGRGEAKAAAKFFKENGSNSIDYSNYGLKEGKMFNRIKLPPHELTPTELKEQQDYENSKTES